MTSPHALLPVLVAILACSPSLAEATAKLFRWVDEEGKVHYSDTIPAEAAHHERAVYDKSQVRKLKVVEKPKTPEELAREARLIQLRQAAKKLLEEQLIRDRALLRTYRTEEDLQLALKGQLNTINTRIQILRANIKRLRALLQNKISRAAEIERNGRKVPKALDKEISAIRRQIHYSETKIAHEKAAKEALQHKFAQDLERFRRLQPYRLFILQTTVTWPNAQLPDTQGVILSVVNCKPDINCDRAWQLARNYVQTHATTPPLIDSNTIIHTQNPRRNHDIALTVARIRGNGQDTLFLDVRCKPSPTGQELCRNPKIQQIRTRFSNFIRSRLQSPTQQGADSSVGKQLQQHRMFNAAIDDVDTAHASR